MTKQHFFRVLSSADSDASGARLGQVQINGRRDLDTPNFLAISSRGVIPHISPDVIAAHTNFGGVHMAVEDCMLSDAISSTEC